VKTHYLNTKHLSLIIFIIGAILLVSCQSDDSDETALYPLFFEELAGYVNQKGEWVIEPAFALAKEFSEGMAPVIVDEGQGTWGFINTEGEIVIEPAFQAVQGFREGYAPIFFDGGWGFIDEEGNIVIDPQYSNAHPFSDGLAVVSVPDEVTGQIEMWGYIDETGEWVIEPQFFLADNFVDGSAPVVTLDSAGFIDKEGNFVNELPEGVAALGYISQGMAVAADHQLEIVEQTCGRGYINQDGDWLIDPQFCNAGPFADGLAAVAIKSEEDGRFLWGYINKDGEIVVDAKYLVALDFYHDLARVLSPEGESGYINKNGEWALVDE
jgi:hypothetical protein